MAQASGISLCSVQRMWDAHRLQPHHLRSFRQSKNPTFAENVHLRLMASRMGAVWLGREVHYLMAGAVKPKECSAAFALQGESLGMDQLKLQNRSPDTAYKIYIQAVDRLTVTNRADETELKMAKHEFDAAQEVLARITEQPVKAVPHQAREQIGSLLDTQALLDQTGWIRLTDAPALLASRFGKCAQRLREELFDALRTATLKHRIAGWNGDNRQWDHMRSAPFFPGEGGSRLPAGCDEKAYIIGEDCFFIAKIYSWTSVRIDWEAGTIANFLGHRSSIEIERTALFAWADKAMDALPDVKPFPPALEDQAVADAVGRDVEPTIEPFLQPHTAAPTTLRTAVLPEPEATAHLRDGRRVPKRAPATVRDDIACKWLQGWVPKFIELNGRKPFIKEVVPVMQQIGFQERVILRAHRSLPSALKQPALNPGNRYGHLTADCL